MDYITPKEAAERWGISERRVEALCANSQIEGAERLGGKVWVIPKFATKPIDGRTKAAKSTMKQGHGSTTLSVPTIADKYTKLKGV